MHNLGTLLNKNVKSAYSQFLPLNRAKLRSKIAMFEKFSLVPFLATKEASVPLASDPIMYGRSMLSFRHIKLRNLPTGDHFIDNSGIIFLVPFLATKEALAPLANDPIM